MFNKEKTLNCFDRNYSVEDFRLTNAKFKLAKHMDILMSNIFRNVKSNCTLPLIRDL